jgi:multidrug efflux pump subunit AcrA (membrane-fusion protein)
VNLDVLRVVGGLDLADAWRIRPGCSVRVYPEIDRPGLAINEEEFTGRVIFVDSEIDTKTQTCKVIAEVKNRDRLLKAGLEVRMEIMCKEIVPGKEKECPRPECPVRPGEKRLTKTK